MKVRRFEAEDRVAVTVCIGELQDFERGLDARVLSGDAVAGWYLDHLLKTCKAQQGAIFVAEDAERVIGFAAVQSKVPNEDVDECDYDYALISDLGVNASHRGQGIGRSLIAACEAFAREKSARWLRIGALGRNATARGLYESCGFAERLVELEKPLSPD